MLTRLGAISDSPVMTLTIGSPRAPILGRQREVVDVNSERSTRETDQRFAELRAIADSLGLVVTGRCKYCGAVISDPKSLEAKAGSVCRNRRREAA